MLKSFCSLGKFSTPLFIMDAGLDERHPHHEDREAHEDRITELQKMFSSLRALRVLRGQNSYFSLRLRGARTFVVRRMEKRSSTDARQLFAEQHIDHSCAADTGFHQHHSGVITDYFSDYLTVTPERMFAHLPEDSGCRV